MVLVQSPQNSLQTLFRDMPSQECVPMCVGGGYPYTFSPRQESFLTPFLKEVPESRLGAEDGSQRMLFVVQASFVLSCYTAVAIDNRIHAVTTAVTQKGLSALQLRHPSFQDDVPSTGSNLSRILGRAMKGTRPPTLLPVLAYAVVLSCLGAKVRLLVKQKNLQNICSLSLCLL